jgi:hypothetical protein
MASTKPDSSEPDFASAALRHVRDAEHLIETGAHTSRDQAWHLAGFAHECARKAYIQTACDSWVPKMLGHDFDHAGDLVLEIAVALEPRAGRFPMNDWAKRYPAIRGWGPEHRYERTGTCDIGRRVDDLVAQAREAVDACVVALFLDGTLAIESLR